MPEDEYRKILNSPSLDIYQLRSLCAVPHKEWLERMHSYASQFREAFEHSRHIQGLHILNSCYETPLSAVNLALIQFPAVGLVARTVVDQLNLAGCNPNSNELSPIVKLTDYYLDNVAIAGIEFTQRVRQIAVKAGDTYKLILNAKYKESDEQTWEKHNLIIFHLNELPAAINGVSLSDFPADQIRRRSETCINLGEPITAHDVIWNMNGIAKSMYAHPRLLRVCFQELLGKGIKVEVEAGHEAQANVAPLLQAISQTAYGQIS